MAYKQHNSPFNSYRDPKRITSNYDIRKIRSMPTFGEGISDETALGKKDVAKEVTPSGTNADNKGDDEVTDKLANVANIDKSAQGDNLDNRIKNASPRQKVRLENKRDKQDHRDARIKEVGELKNKRKALARDTREEARTERGINRQDKILKRQVNRGVITEEQAEGLKKDQLKANNKDSNDEKTIKNPRKTNTLEIKEEPHENLSLHVSDFVKNTPKDYYDKKPSIDKIDKIPNREAQPINIDNSRSGPLENPIDQNALKRQQLTASNNMPISNNTVNTFNEDLDREMNYNPNDKTKAEFRGFMTAPMNMKKQDNMKQITRRGSALPMLGPDETAPQNVNRAGGATNKTLAPNPAPPQPPNQVSAQVQQQADMMTGIAQDPGVLNTDENNAAQIAQAQQTLGQPTNTIGDGVGTTNTEPTFGGAPAKKQDPPKETSAKTDATTNVIPGAGQYNKESVSFDYEMQPYRGHQGTYSQKRDASEHKRREYYKHMDSAKGKSAASGFPITNTNGPSKKETIDFDGKKVSYDKGGMRENLTSQNVIKSGGKITPKIMREAKEGDFGSKAKKQANFAANRFGFTGTK